MVPGQADCEATPRVVIASSLEGRLSVWWAAQPGDREAAADQLMGRARALCGLLLDWMNLRVNVISVELRRTLG